MTRNGTGRDDKARVLHGLHQGACLFFDGVMGPGYNLAHAAHLHCDRGLCHTGR